MEKYTRNELMKIMPHRDPMLLIDEAWIETDGTVHSIYKVRGDEFFCIEMEPGVKTVPGTILMEIMAQSCVIAKNGITAGNIALYSGIDHVTFMRTVRAGDVCQVRSRLISQKNSLSLCYSRLDVDGEICCHGELSFVLLPAGGAGSPHIGIK